MATTQTIPVTGMHCASCATIIGRTIKKLPGVQDATVNYATEHLSVTFDASATSTKKMDSMIEPLGYRLRLETGMGDRGDQESMGDKRNERNKDTLEIDHEKQTLQIILPMAVFLFIAMMWDIASQAVAFIPPIPYPMRFLNTISFFMATYVLFGSGRPFIRAIFTFLKHRAANMDTLIGIGTSVAYIYSSFIYLFPVSANLYGLSNSLYFDVTVIVIAFIKLENT